MYQSKDYVRFHDREVILLKERREKAGKELLIYSICVLVCAVLYFGWMKFYWPDFCIHLAILGGPWSVAMTIVNLIRWTALSRKIRKLVAERSK